MPRKKTYYIDKIVNLHIHRDSLKTFHQKHELIETLKDLLGLSFDKVTNQLSLACAKAGINARFTNRSAHSSFVKKYSVKPAIDTLDNTIDIHIAIDKNNITENYPYRPLAVKPFKKSENVTLNTQAEIHEKINDNRAKAYTHVPVTFSIKSTHFPLWYEMNQALIAKVNELANDDTKYEDECLEIILQILQSYSPANEKHLIEPTKRWFRKNISKDSVLPKTKNKPFHAALFTTIATGKLEEDPIEMTLLFKSYDYIGYIPCKLHLRDNPFFESGKLKRDEYKYTLGIQKEGKVCTLYIDFKDKDGDRCRYALKLKQEIRQINTPFGSTPVFKPDYVWNEKLPDKEYLIVKEAPLSSTQVNIVSKTGGTDTRNIELTWYQFHERLSVFNLKQRKDLILAEVNSDSDIPMIEVTDGSANLECY
ncbi:hypothetical protein FCV63_00575 [Vibrio lentus]|uniref:hypothetical protein n=1 Tax=Vibrio lentus TaxID=136468 RepID=UPI0010BD1330|nr:hypothetical protein [Vibrio lentus]TKF61488.1 hypothetical protein FCV63_00575 [Vibrio lentus]